MISSTLKSLASTIAIVALSWSPVLALTCETDVSKFDYTNDTPTTFSYGEKKDVDEAYSKLAETVGSLDIYSKPVVFFTKGYKKLTQYTCPGEKCSSADIGKGFSVCVESPRDANESCFPLAVVYNEKMYCLLAPGGGELDLSKKFEPYVPFSSGKSK